MDKRQEFEKETGSLEDRLSTALAKISLAARYKFQQLAAADGLSAVQAQILSLLSTDGSMLVGDLSKRLALTPATISDSITALERKKLVSRQPLVTDRRKILVKASRKGLRVGRSLSLWPELFAKTISQIPDCDKEAFFRVVIRIILSLLEQGIIQDSRMCVTCSYFRPNVHNDSSHPHHCALVDLPLALTSLRIDCPDHKVASSPTEVLHVLNQWLRVAQC